MPRRKSPRAAAAPRPLPPEPANPVHPRANEPLPAWIPTLGLAALHLLLCLLALDPGAFPGGDNGAYVSLARGILERGVYVDYWDPAMAPHTLYPPVFPLILAAGLGAGLTVWMGVKLLCLALSAASVGLAYLWLRRVLPPRGALVVGGLVAIAPGALALANQVLSDVPFWGWTMLTLWAYARLEEEPGGWRWEALGAAAVTLAFFTRSAGLPLAIAALLWLLLRRRWRGAGLLVLALGPASLAWTLRTRALGVTSAYEREFWWVNPYVPSLGTIGPMGLLARMLDNLRRYGSEHVPVMFFGYTGRTAPWVVVGAVLLVALAVAGWAGRVRRPGVAELFVPLYVGLLLVWPSTWGGERFVLPILPLLLAYAALALRGLAAKVGAARLVPAGAALMGLLALPGLRLQIQLGAACRAEYRAGSLAPCLAPEWSELLSIGQLLRGRLPAGSVVIHRKPTLFFAASGYRSRLYPKSEDPDTFFAMAREIRAGYAVVDQIPDMSPYLHAVLLARPERFCVVAAFSTPNATLVRIVDNPPPRRATARPGEFRTCPVAGPPFPGAPVSASQGQLPGP